ncbi:hypothetical protein HYD90_03875 [Mycoplasmopsis bovis]|nr:hypothetical protein [Mycoplasmopsis bovis]QQH36027.1 hypothetical protein HYD90_03875 [Mycoplasmopsis bovis]
MLNKDKAIAKSGANSGQGTSANQELNSGQGTSAKSGSNNSTKQFLSVI